jgi:hypothetical protein
MDRWEVMTSGREWVWGTKQKVFAVPNYNQQHFLLLHLVSCNLELYYDARTYEYQIYKCQTDKRSISVQEHQKQTVQSKCSSKKRCILLAVTWNYITVHGHMNIRKCFFPVDITSNIFLIILFFCFSYFAAYSWREDNRSSVNEWRLWALAFCKWQNSEFITENIVVLLCGCRRVSL